MSAVLVTGATGTVGSSVVENLLAGGERVVAAVRRPADAGRLPAGAVARTFDFGWEPERLAPALEGVDRVFLMRPPAIPDVRNRLFPFLDLARGRGVRVR